MRKLDLAIAAIFLVSLAGCAYLEGVKGRAGAEPSQMSESPWPKTGNIDFVTDD